MTIAKLASNMCKREGKKSQVTIGNMRESLKVLVQLQVEAMTGVEEDPEKGLRMGGETPFGALFDAFDTERKKLKAKQDKLDAKAKAKADKEAAKAAKSEPTENG